MAYVSSLQIRVEKLGNNLVYLLFPTLATYLETKVIAFDVSFLLRLLSNQKLRSFINIHLSPNHFLADCVFTFVSGAYEHLRRSGFIELPHRTTLNKYTWFASSGSGFNVEIIKRFCEYSDIANMKPHEKQVILLFEEMKIKSGLVYSKYSNSSGRVIDFTKLGDMNDELNEFERRMTDNKLK